MCAPDADPDAVPRDRTGVFTSGIVPQYAGQRLALFYQTPTGAHVGDLFMSLTHTCELAGANPFDYLTVLQRQRDALAATPAVCMLWNYRQTLATVTTGA